MHIDSDGWIDGATRRPSPHVGGEIEPLIVVNHWTAGGGADISVQVLENRGLCAQLVGPREGGFIQCAPLHRFGHHAGVSSWRGMSSCSRFAIGIEWANWGPLFYDEKHGQWFTAYFNERTGLSVPYHGAEPVKVKGTGVTIQHHGGPWQAADWFEPFSPYQIETAEEAHLAMAARYPSLVEAVDHATICPGRKVDCIPWQPMIAGWGQAFAGRDLQQRPSVGPASEADRPLTNARRAQEALNALGHRGRDGKPLLPDGIMGPQTHHAIRSFQIAQGLQKTGVLDSATVPLLLPEEQAAA